MEISAEVCNEMVELRRAIHTFPELGLDNPLTQKRVLEALEGLELDIKTGSGISSIVADLHGDRDGPVILLRADSDALPMLEESGEEFASKYKGCAHTCGHDAHVAMLVGAARTLSELRSEIPGTIRFVFQPGEEAEGGAAQMIAEGALGLDDGRHVAAAFAQHVTPNIPLGYVASRAGSLMASADEFTVEVRGKGAHASTPHFGNDPIPVASEVVLGMQTYVTRNVDAHNPAVVTVGRFAAGTTHNVIPEVAELQGTVRTTSEWTRAAVSAGLRQLIEGICSAHGCTSHIEYTHGYPVTVNDTVFTEFASDVCRDLFGVDYYFELPTPVMGAEDFSYFLNEVPGAMVFLGVCPDDIENSLEAPSVHSNHMRLNEKAMPLGAALHCEIALRWLRQNA